MPDLSQYSDPSWLYYCGPTAGADVAYGLGLGGTPPGNGAAADAVINDLASKMSTNVGLNGTSHTNLRDGLDLYLETASGDPAGNVWTTQLFLTASQPGGGNDIWNILTSALSAGAGVVMMVDWPNQVPNGPGGQEGFYEDPQTPGQIGHAIALDGFTTGGTETLSFMDPGNNTTHAFAPVTPDSSPIFRDATKMELSAFPGGGGSPVIANVVGVVTTIPEPSTRLLIGAALLLALGATRRR